MRSNKKYKGKYTKKRLYNIVRGQYGDFQDDSVEYELFLRRISRGITYAWYQEGKITFEQFQQWGY